MLLQCRLVVCEGSRKPNLLPRRDLNGKGMMGHLTLWGLNISPFTMHLVIFERLLCSERCPRCSGHSSKQGGHRPALLELSIWWGSDPPTQTGWIKWQTFITHSPRSWKSEIRVPAWSGSGEVPPFGVQTATFQLRAQMEEKEIIFLLLPVMRTLIPPMRAPPSWPNYLPKAPPQIPSP